MNPITDGTWRARLGASRRLGPVLLALLVGLAAGAGGIAFRFLIDGARWLAGPGLAAATGADPTLLMVLVLIAGLVIVSLSVQRWAPEARGHGVPEVMFAVRKRGGRIRPRVAIVKTLASALCIGTGGAVGREGPIVQIGCSLGSTLGQWLGLRDSGVRLLVACGAAGAIGGTFNAPLAGVVFALEVILDDFEARSFGMVVVSAVAATALVQAALGNDPAFALPHEFILRSPLELPLFLVMGALLGLLAVAFSHGVSACEERFHRWRAPRWLQAAAAATLVGVLAVATDGRVLGVGYETIEQSLRGEVAIALLLGLAAAKIAATALTLGGGGSGGVFAPALFVGASAGGAFGHLMRQWFPSFAGDPGAYALVGMGALFAGAAHAPITAILILFEMTDNYQVILPLMLAVVTSHLVATAISHDSIYSIKLRQLGGLDSPRPGLSVLDSLIVADAMSPEPVSVAPEDAVVPLAARMHREHWRSAPVVTADGELVGIVTEHDVEEALLSNADPGLHVEAIMTRQLLTCSVDEKLSAVLRRFHSRAVRQIPVVAEGSPLRLLGVLRREELLWAYGEVAAEHEAMLAAAPDGPGEASDDSVLLDMTVHEGETDLCFKRVRELGVPPHCLIVRMRRGGHDVIPKGVTRIEPGDILTLHTSTTHATALRRWIAERQPAAPRP